MEENKMTIEEIIHDLQALRDAFVEDRDCEPLCLSSAIDELKKYHDAGVWIEEDCERDLCSPGGKRWRCPICNHWQGYGNPKHCPSCGAALGECQEVEEA